MKVEPCPRSLKSSEALPENFRRSTGGSKLIRQEVSKLMHLYSTKFPQHPVFDKDGKLLGAKTLGPTCKELLDRAPSFFSTWLHEKRSPVEFGKQVHAYITRMYSALNADSRKEFVRFLHDIWKGSVGPADGK